MSETLREIPDSLCGAVAQDAAHAPPKPPAPNVACPSGPPWALDWNNDASPSLMDVATQADATTFLGTRQFTIRATKTFSGTVPEGARRSGIQTVTWSWETTYRKVEAKRKKKRRRA